jgi:hypothetical protein
MSIPLPAVRMTVPPVPVYGPPTEPLAPRPKEPVFKGKVAALTLLGIFAVLLAGAVFLLKWLSGPS